MDAEHRHDTGGEPGDDDGRSLIVDIREEFGRDGGEDDTSSEVLDVAFHLRAGSPVEARPRQRDSYTRVPAPAFRSLSEVSAGTGKNSRLVSTTAKQEYPSQNWEISLCEIQKLDLITTLLLIY